MLLMLVVIEYPVHGEGYRIKLDRRYIGVLDSHLEVTERFLEVRVATPVSCIDLAQNYDGSFYISSSINPDTFQKNLSALILLKILNAFPIS